MSSTYEAPFDKQKIRSDLLSGPAEGGIIMNHVGSFSIQLFDETPNVNDGYTKNNFLTGQQVAEAFLAVLQKHSTQFTTHVEPYCYDRYGHFRYQMSIWADMRMATETGTITLIPFTNRTEKRAFFELDQRIHGIVIQLRGEPASFRTAMKLIKSGHWLTTELCNELNARFAGEGKCPPSTVGDLPEFPIPHKDGKFAVKMRAEQPA